MAKTFIQQYTSTPTFGSGVTTYLLAATGSQSARTTEAQRQITYNFNCTLSDLILNIPTNTADYGSTILSRKNGSDGNLSISIGAGVTGVLEDTSHSDSITASDEVCFKVANGTGTGNYNVRCLNFVVNPSDGTVSIPGYGTSSSTTSASTTSYVGITNGFISSTESNVQSKVKKSGTLKNLFVYVSANARDTQTDFKSRIDSADGNLIVGVPGTTTGIFEDTSNSDSVSADSSINFARVTGTGLNTITFVTLASNYVTSDSTGNILGLYNNTITSTASQAALGSAFAGGGLDYQTKTNVASTFSLLVVYIISNTFDGTYGTSFAVDGSSSSLSVSIGSSLTGTFEDTTNSVAVSASEAVGLNIDTSSVSSGSVGIKQINVVYTVGNEPVAESSRRFDLNLLSVGS